MSEGVVATPMPAAWKASIFAAAVPFAARNDGARMTHAASRRRHQLAMNPATGFVPCVLIHSAASSSAAPPISPIMMIPWVSGSDMNILMMSRWEVPFTGSPPMPTPRALADAAAGQLPDRLVGQGSGARHHPDMSLLVDVPRRNANSAATHRISTFPRESPLPGQLGPIRRVLTPRIARFTRTMSTTGMPSVIAAASSSPASTPSRMASAATGGGTKMALAVAPVCRTASADRVKNGNRLAVVGEHLPALAGSDAGHHLGAVIEGKLRVPGAESARDALDQDLGLRCDENSHGKIE